jgi:hypothetical protein
VLLNPVVIESFMLGQLPFLWAAAMLFAAIALWRRQSLVAAVIAAAAAQATHPAVVMPIAALLVVMRLPYENDRGRFVAAYGLSAGLALPAAALVLLSPTLSDAGFAVALSNLVGTVAVRSLAFAVPLVLALWYRRIPRRVLAWLPVMPLLVVAALAMSRDSFAWKGLVREPDHSVREFSRSGDFQPGATYRVLRALDGKVSMYDVLVDGGRLDSEFFPESMHRRSFVSLPAYKDFLADRGVDYVVLFDSYTRHFQTNESELLEELVSSGDAAVIGHGEGFTVFRVIASPGARSGGNQTLPAGR